jgi:hypothetical protein
VIVLFPNSWDDSYASPRPWKTLKIKDLGVGLDTDVDVVLFPLDFLTVLHCKTPFCEGVGTRRGSWTLSIRSNRPENRTYSFF